MTVRAVRGTDVVRELGKPKVIRDPPALIGPAYTGGDGHHALPTPNGSCSPPRAATAPASIAPSRPSSARSSSTARRSTCARRSSTTSTWSRQLRERGAIFVDELDDTIPEGATTVFSAHGVSPAVHADAKQRNLCTLDATCPLVTKVHVEAKKFAAEGYTIVLIGHAGHEEVEGTMGEAPEHIVLVETEADVDALEVADPSGSPTSPRPRCRSTRRARSSPACARSSRTSPGRARTTSVTRPPTARRRSSRWPPSATSCS